MQDTSYRRALVGEIDSAIEMAKLDPIGDLPDNGGTQGCSAHGALVRAIREDSRNQAFGQIVLLRCEKARLESPIQTVADAATAVSAKEMAKEVAEILVNQTGRHLITRKEMIGWCAGAGAFMVGAFETLRKMFEKLGS
jgi:hypothetical protein